MRIRAGLVLTGTVALLGALFATGIPAAQAVTETYRVQLDAKPPKGEPWDFMRIFPAVITVHQGDVIDAAWANPEAPHTATLVPSDDANAWRDANQGPGGPQDPSVYPYALQVLDTSVGGDDAEVILNPAVAAPTNPMCGADATTPCDFDGVSVASSGFMQGAGNHFFARVTAPVGTYSLLCLLHPGMQETINVVAASETIPSPQDVADEVHQEVQQAKRVDGPAADAQAQMVRSKELANGHRLWTIWAGGFSNGVSANEFPDAGLAVQPRDRIRVKGNFEIHTATFPLGSADTTPFILSQCEVAGPDTPATSPADCASPADFQLAFNPTAIMPTASNKLVAADSFVNSGLLTYGNSFTFIARKAGAYQMVCLVHGKMMSTTVSVHR